MGFLSHLLDTIAYIREHGWHEWRLARERYDKHIRAEEARQFKYSRKGEVEMQKQIKKAKRK